MSAAEILGMAASIVSFVAYVVYWIAIFRKEDATRPSRSTWWILTGLDVMITLSYWESGARETAWLPLSLAVCSFITALLSLKWGMGGREPLDVVCFIGTILSIPLWIAFGATAALWLTIAVDVLALAPTIQKSWTNPETEDRLAWAITGVAVSLELATLFVTENVTLEVALYPVNIFWMDMLIVGLLFRRRSKSPTTRPAQLV